jgi:DNA-binding MarR family transcriptional regulator
MTATSQEPAATELSPHEHLGRSFKAAMAAVRRLRGRETQKPGALSNAQYGLLFGLAGACGEMSSKDLADAADLTPATVTQMLDSLETHGFVTRVRSERDKRVVVPTLTQRGEEVIAEHRARVEPRWRAALAEFSDDELLTTAAVLDRLREYFENFERE